MKIEMLIVVALVAVVVALFAWAVTAFQKASPRKPVIGNANRKFFRSHLRKVFLAPLLIERFAAWLGFTRQPQNRVMFANIGEGSFETGTKTYVADAATASRYLCYKTGTDADHCAVCGAGDTPLGQSNDQAEAGLPIAISLFGLKPGTLRVVTDGTIANGDHVKCGAAGVVTKASSTDRSFGIALIGTDASSASGDVITIQHCVPHLYVF